MPGNIVAGYIKANDELQRRNLELAIAYQNLRKREAKLVENIPDGMRGHVIAELPPLRPLPRWHEESLEFAESEGVSLIPAFFATMEEVGEISIRKIYDLNDDNGIRLGPEIRRIPAGFRLSIELAQMPKELIIYSTSKEGHVERDLFSGTIVDYGADNSVHLFDVFALTDQVLQDAPVQKQLKEKYRLTIWPR